MIEPHLPDQQEAEHEAHVAGPQRGQPVEQTQVLREPDLQTQQRDGDRDDAVAEGLQSPRRHASGLVIRLLHRGPLVNAISTARPINTAAAVTPLVIPTTRHAVHAPSTSSPRFTTGGPARSRSILTAPAPARGRS